MKKFKLQHPARWPLGLAVVLVACAISGCLERRIIWSPDGSRAAVIAEGNLRFCDAGGRLSAPVASDVKTFGWLDDDGRFVMVRNEKVDTWAALASTIDQERAEAIDAAAGEVLAKLKGGALWDLAGGLFNDDRDAVRLCLRDTRGEALRSLADFREDRFADIDVKMWEVTAARLVPDGSVTAGKRLWAGLEEVMEIRPSPEGRFVAIVHEQVGEGKNADIDVVPSDGSSAAVRVAENAAAYPDWSDDGRALVHVLCAARGDTGDSMSLGTLIQRTIIGKDGRLELADQHEELAGVLFNLLTRVRCLKDGRILFNAMELSLPVGMRDETQREQLFVMDPARSPLLARVLPRQSEADVPDILAFFEVSPDGKQIVFGGTKGVVSLLTLATGAVDHLQDSGKNDMQGAPVWRADGALTFLRRLADDSSAVEAETNASRQIEVIVRRGTEETVLSRDWPDEIVNGVAK